MARHPLARGRGRGGGRALISDDDDNDDGDDGDDENDDGDGPEAIANDDGDGPETIALAGCCGFGGPRQRYYAQLSLVELQDTFRAIPREAVLARWRAEAPPGFAFAMRAAQLITHETPAAAAAGPHGMLRPTPTVRAACDQTFAAARALDARAVLFETPVDFTPTATNRQRLTEFFSAIARDERLLVWMPQGVWADAEVQRICADLALVPATTIVSPDDELEAPNRYFRLNAPRFTEDELWLLAAQMRACDAAYCVFNSGSMFRDAQRLQTLLDGDEA